MFERSLLVSLRNGLTDVAKAYQSATGNTVSAKYGPSGLLKNELSEGAKADVFASANMEHPQALHDEKKSGPVIRFARKALRAGETRSESGQREPC
jgi:molybdate transport system substrate-binding protein